MSVDQLIDRYEAGGPLLPYAVSGLGPEQLTAKPGPGAWSTAELAAHLLDCDLVFADRMKRIIAEKRPTLVAFDEQAWLDRLGSAAMPADEAAALFAANRRWMARVLRARPEADFARVGEHSEAGPITLAEVVAKAAGHVDHHLTFLYAKRANLGLSIYPRYA
ncbi:MAG TPA: DinB family protein, partial [Isosphaeraceae bacterium]|nr:DinB family protein [Isosphaeraceae bacterium]